MTNKVLFTASTFSHILNFHIPYLKWFRDRGWIVHVACGGEPAPIPDADRVVVLPFKKSMASTKNFRAAALLRRLIREETYDLISTHTSLAAFFTRLAVKDMRQRPPVVNTVHGYLFDGDASAVKRRVLLLAERITAAQTDLLMTMNLWDFQLAQKEKLGRRVVHIPGMGVDFSGLEGNAPDDSLILRRKWGIPDEAFVMIYPAEFSERKSQAVLIQAMTKLPVSCVLVLPGQGALLEECRAVTRRLELTGRVIFPGQVVGMGSWYAMADAAVSASRGEGLPFNVLEAMHCGLPVAASKVKGHTDLIQDGVTGLLYPYGNADACAAAIRSLMSSASLRRELGRSAKENVEQYSLERVLPEIVRRYSELLPEPIAAETKS